MRRATLENLYFFFFIENELITQATSVSDKVAHKNLNNIGTEKAPSGDIPDHG